MRMRRGAKMFTVVRQKYNSSLFSAVIKLLSIQKCLFFTNSKSYLKIFKATRIVKLTIMEENKKDVKSYIDKILGDVSKTSATKQIIIGASSGWLTGYLAMKVGRAAAFALGGGIILLELANEKGYIKINWDKIHRQIDKVSDKVEEKISGQSSSWTDKMENYVDRKSDKVETLVKDRKKVVKTWFSSITGTNDKKLKEIHVFIISFVAGVAIGIGTS